MNETSSVNGESLYHFVPTKAIPVSKTNAMIPKITCPRNTENGGIHTNEINVIATNIQFATTIHYIAVYSKYL